MQYGAETESRLASGSQDKAEHQLGTLKWWDNVVSGVTRYELDVSGKARWWGRNFQYPSNRNPRPNHPPVQCITCPFWTSIARGVDLTTHPI